MPYGILADRVGRKPALLSSWCGMILGFAYIMGFIYLARDRNLYFVLTGSLFQVFGGGLSVAFSTIYAVASDVTANQNCATSFFYLAISATLGGITGPPLAGKIMMLYGPWAPIFVVFALSPPIIVLILLLPETLPQPALPPQKQAFSSSISRSISALSTSFHELLPSLQLLCNRNIQLVMAVFFLQTPIYIAYSTIMVQSTQYPLSSQLAAPLTRTVYPPAVECVAQGCGVDACGAGTGSGWSTDRVGIA
ncbi:multidrug efflux system translocase MdfA [Ceratocystis platani]|uniref:Multidrug efflux system translocase MdfA n=2 Tax=Ceratocystis TaxID=5157 RepID=A0A0F8CSX8_CERFI|nr:multidrug efflux system translocase MdfA [Ceratocystis platani]